MDGARLFGPGRAASRRWKISLAPGKVRLRPGSYVRAAFAPKLTLWRGGAAVASEAFSSTRRRKS